MLERQRIMKKLLLISLALILVLTLCACGETTPTEPTQPTDSTPTQPHEHKYEMSKTNPTCTVDGALIHYCSCGDSYSEPIYAIGHDLGTLTITKAPSMTQTGIGVRVCNSCKVLPYKI